MKFPCVLQHALTCPYIQREIGFVEEDNEGSKSSKTEEEYLYSESDAIHQQLVSLKVHKVNGHAISLN